LSDPDSPEAKVEMEVEAEEQDKANK